MRRHEVRHGLLFDRDRDLRDSQDLEYAKPYHHLTLDHEISPGLSRLPEIKIKIKDAKYQSGLLFQKEEKRGSGSIEVRRAQQLLFLHLHSLSLQIRSASRWPDGSQSDSRTSKLG